MERIQRKHPSPLTTWHASLLLLLFVVLFETIVPVASSLNDQLQKDQRVSQCSGISSDPCKNMGYLGPDCKCVCPAGTSGANCETKIMSYSDALIRELLPQNERVTSPPSPQLPKPTGLFRLSTHNITARSLVLSWEEPADYYISYFGVPKWRSGTRHIGDAPILNKDANGATSVFIDGLQPYTDYTIRVAANSVAMEGQATFIEATTLEGEPSKPTNLTASNEVLKTIDVNWSEPEVSNGVLGQYNISWYMGNLTVGHALVPYPFYTIKSLSPCVEYRVRVAATTGAGEGDYEEVTQITRGAREVTCFRHSQSQNVTVAWMNHDPNCPITSYDVIDRIAKTTVTVNSSINRHTLNFPSKENLSQLCVAGRMAGVRGEWTCCKDSERIDAGHLMISKTTIYLVVGGVLGGVLLLLMVIVILIRKWSAKRASDDYIANLEVTVKKDIESLGHPAALARHFEILNKESHVDTITAAQQPANLEKNLFSNVLPFDCNRVALKRFKSDVTDYINASFVKSPVKGDVCFIACQSPKSNTINDFWWMVWEQEVTTIVMLVRSDIPELTKSIQYWPAPGKEMCSSITITTIEREVSYYLVKRKFQLVRLGEKRIVRHYQLVSWPEFSVPNSKNELLMLMKEVREHVGHRRHPVVVHCSAGVGQTGTFIGLWQLQVKADRRLPKICVRGTVLEMRRHRQMMVQLPVQYQFLHVCFLTYLQDMQSWKPGSGRPKDIKEHKSTNRCPKEGKESNQGTEVNLLIKHPDFGPLPSLPTVPLSATSDDYAVINEADTEEPYDYPVIPDNMKVEILQGTQKRTSNDYETQKRDEQVLRETT